MSCGRSTGRFTGEIDIQESGERNMKGVMCEQGKQQSIVKICFLGVLIYSLLAVSLYFLMGEQLHLRESRANIESVNPEAAIIELAQGSWVEQRFITKIQRIEHITLPWSTFFRTNTGTVTVELLELNSGSIVFQQKLLVEELPENIAISIDIPIPLEGLYEVPLALRLTGNSPLGAGVAPLMATSGETADSMDVLLVNGQEIKGTLCFSMTGTDYIWTGVHYWEFSLMGGVLLLGILVYMGYLMKRGKAATISHAIAAVRRYWFLMEQLVKRDFKSKYKRSILGVFWSFLNPLLTMCVQYLVFSNIFRFDIPYYAVYLLTGIVCFNFFSECCGMTLNSIVGNASLITKVYVPKYIYPLTRTLSSGINLIISMIPLLGIALFSGLLPTRAYILAIFPLICLTIFCLGVGMILAASMVFFRDTQFLWGVICMIWMYLTPIFYSVDILPKALLSILKWNPLYYFLEFLRICIIKGISPEPIMYVQCLLFALGALALGAWIFKKTQNRFVLYL